VFDSVSTVIYNAWPDATTSCSNELMSGAQPRFQSWGCNPSPLLRQARPFPAALDSASPKAGSRGITPKKMFNTRLPFVIFLHFWWDECVFNSCVFWAEMYYPTWARKFVKESKTDGSHFELLNYNNHTIEYLILTDTESWHRRYYNYKAGYENLLDFIICTSNSHYHRSDKWQNATLA